MAPAQRFDFIVAGGGTSGFVAAARLAGPAARPTVLLVEAGAVNGGFQHRLDADRWHHKNTVPGGNWHYLTKPQEHLNHRRVDYNDHDEIARLVGHDEWKWENAHQRYKRLESYKAFTSDIPTDVSKYLAPHPGDHGNPIGLAVCPNTAYKGERTNSSEFLTRAPRNPYIATDAQVARVLFEGRRAMGVETLDGRKFFASKEIILSAASLDTPRILMHSGIGPADQFRQYEVPVLVDNTSVGQNLQDHYQISRACQRDESTSTRPQFFRGRGAQEAARKEWQESRTGP